MGRDPDSRPLRAWRKARGWRLDDVADRLGVSRQAVYSLERRTTRDGGATLATLRRVADLYELNIEELLAGPPQEIEAPLIAVLPAQALDETSAEDASIPSDASGEEGRPASDEDVDDPVPFGRGA